MDGFRLLRIQNRFNIDEITDFLIENKTELPLQKVIHYESKKNKKLGKISARMYTVYVCVCVCVCVFVGAKALFFMGFFLSVLLFFCVSVFDTTLL